MVSPENVHTNRPNKRRHSSSENTPSTTTVEPPADRPDVGTHSMDEEKLYEGMSQKNRPHKAVIARMGKRMASERMVYIGRRIFEPVMTKAEKAAMSSLKRSIKDATKRKAAKLAKQTKSSSTTASPSNNRGQTGEPVPLSQVACAVPVTPTQAVVGSVPSTLVQNPLPWSNHLPTNSPYPVADSSAPAHVVLEGHNVAAHPTAYETVQPFLPFDRLSQAQPPEVCSINQPIHDLYCNTVQHTAHTFHNMPTNQRFFARPSYDDPPYTYRTATLEHQLYYDYSVPDSSWSATETSSLWWPSKPEAASFPQFLHPVVEGSPNNVQEPTASAAYAPDFSRSAVSVYDGVGCSPGAPWTSVTGNVIESAVSTYPPCNIAMGEKIGGNGLESGSQSIPCRFAAPTPVRPLSYIAFTMP